MGVDKGGECMHAVTDRHTRVMIVSELASCCWLTTHETPTMAADCLVCACVSLCPDGADQPSLPG